MPPTDAPPPPSATDPPAPSGGDAGPLRDYLAAFLSPAAADEALRDLQTAWPDASGDRTTLLRQARLTLQRRIDVPLALEVAVLVEDLDVAPAIVADVLGVPPATVDAIIAREGLRWPADPTATDTPGVGSDPGGQRGDPAPPEVGTPASPEVASAASPEVASAASPEVASAAAVERPARRRPQRGLWLALGLVVVVVILGGLAAVSGVLSDVGGGGETGTCEPTEQRPICVAEARVTDVVDRSGSPGASRKAFAAGETVKLWFAFEQLDPAEPALATYVWFRDGAPLYADDFRLPPGGRANVTLAQTFATQPGAYAVQIRLRDDVLVERSFSIG